MLRRREIVTVSLGGTTNMPSHGAMDCGSLVAAADRALYAAKNSGRDRLVMSGQVVAWPGARSA
jgi:PleD family two-component response regulator